MTLRFTSTAGHPERHFCPDCADNKQEVQDELEAAREKGALETSYDILDEVCSSCGRRIANVPGVPGMYSVEMEVTFKVKVAFHHESAAAAGYDFRTELADVFYEDAEDKIEEAIREGIGDLEIEKGHLTVSFQSEIHDPARLVPPDSKLIPGYRIVSPAQQRLLDL